MTYVFKRSYRGPLKAVLLDWAGTTLDFGCMAPAAVFLEVFKKKGVEITIEQAREPMGKHKKDHIRQVLFMPEVAKKWAATFGQTPTEADVESLFVEFVPAQIACLAKYAELIPGTTDAIGEFRKRGLKIGSTTGYTKEMMEILCVEAKKRGYEPDATVCANEVPQARPAPWMCFENAKRLGIYPMEAIVKVGDTIADIQEGLNAGMWTIGLATTGNEMCMTLEEASNPRPTKWGEGRVRGAYDRMYAAGAHFVVDGIWDVPQVIDEINGRLNKGERP